MNARATANRMTTWCLPGLLSLLAMVLINYHDGMCAEWKVVTKRYELSEVLYAIQDEGLKKHTGFYFPEYRIDDKVLYYGYRPIEPGEDVEKRSERADSRHVWKTHLSKPIVPDETVFLYNRIYVENVDRYSISLHLSKSDVWIEKMVIIPFTGYQLPLNTPLSSWRGNIDNVETSRDTREADTIDKMLITVYPKGDRYDFVIGDFRICIEQYRTKQGYSGDVYVPEVTENTMRSYFPFAIWDPLMCRCYAFWVPAIVRGSSPRNFALREFSSRKGTGSAFFRRNPRVNCSARRRVFPMATGERSRWKRKNDLTISESSPEACRSTWNLTLS